MNSNSSKPLIDIVITAHNMESCLGECLQSLAAQTFGDFAHLSLSTDPPTAPKALHEPSQIPMIASALYQPQASVPAEHAIRGSKRLTRPISWFLTATISFIQPCWKNSLPPHTTGRRTIAICDMQEFDDATKERNHVAWALKRSQLPRTSAFNGWQDTPGNIFAAFMGWPWDKLYRTEFVLDSGIRFPEDLPNSEDMLFTYPLLVLGTAHCRGG